MGKREKKLVRAAAKALGKLDRYRARHQASAAEAAALHHVYVSARLAGWPDSGARDAARTLLGAGVTPLAAQRMFSESERRVQ